MISGSENEALELLKLFLEDLGLSGSYEDPTVRPGVYSIVDSRGHGLAFTFSFSSYPEIHSSTNKPFVRSFAQLKERILRSPMVQNEIEKVEQKLKMANLACDELVLRVRDLEKYKNYYDVEMSLRHGAPCEPKSN